MIFSDLALSRRLERAEGDACLKFAQARRHVFPECCSEWMECGGGFAVFDGVDSPITQCFALGMTEPLMSGVLDTVEQFFFARGAAAMLEVSPLAGVEALDLLCSRGYRPMEISSVMYRRVEAPAAIDRDDIRVRITGAEDSQIWSDVSARGWAHEIPDMIGFLNEMGRILSARENGPCFLAEIDGQPGAAGVLCLHEGVALFGGAATVPELRRRGLQAALFDARMRYAAETGCDLAMVVTQPGSNSQRNAERKGFRIAYTRAKWRLAPPA